MDQIMSTFTIIQPFALTSAKGEKLWRVLPNVIEMYLEFSTLYILVEIFWPRSFLKAARNQSSRNSFRNLGIYCQMEFLQVYQTLRVSLFVYLLLQMKKELSKLIKSVYQLWTKTDKSGYTLQSTDMWKEEFLWSLKTNLQKVQK